MFRSLTLTVPYRSPRCIFQISPADSLSHKETKNTNPWRLMKLFIALSLVIAASFATSFAQEKNSLVSLESLNQAAKQKVDARPNVTLAGENADICIGADVLEEGRIPNYARGLALLPEAAKPLAETFKA